MLKTLKNTIPVLIALSFTVSTYGIGFITLHNFDNIAGEEPDARLVLSGGTLYGVTDPSDVFAINTNGTGFNNVYDTGGIPSGLILSGNTFYGTTAHGDNVDGGMVFALNTAGTEFTILHKFTGSDGYRPEAGLVLSGNTLYGTTSESGLNGQGTVFRIDTDGNNFTNLYNFSGPDGSIPASGLVLLGNILYGTTQHGGNGYGTVFAVNIDGTGFTNIYKFNGNDGSGPSADLVLSDGVLYGTTYSGGTNAGGGNTPGTVFRINPDGTDFTNLYNFSGTDGYAPNSALISSGNTLYGTTANGGPNKGYGTVFAINTDGTGFTNLYSFSGADGGDPYGVILLGNTLFGTTFDGGSGDRGTVFALTLTPGPIPLNNQSISDALVLSWGNAGFLLQAAPTVTGTYTNIPGATTPYTNVMSDAQKFFRLQAQ